MATGWNVHKHKKKSWEQHYYHVIPGSNHFCPKYLHCGWVTACIHRLSYAQTVQVLMHIVTAYSVPLFLFLAFILHLISILLLLTTKRSNLPSQLPIQSHFPGVHSQFPPSLHSLSHSKCKHGSPQASQIHTFHIFITRFIFFFPLFSAWPHRLPTSTQTYYSIS